jgi:hypothetical protein
MWDPFHVWINGKVSSFLGRGRSWSAQELRSVPERQLPHSFWSPVKWSKHLGPHGTSGGSGDIWRVLVNKIPSFCKAISAAAPISWIFFRVRCVGHDKSGLLVISAMLGIAGYGSKRQPCWDCFTRKKSCLHIDSVCYCSSWHIPIVFFCHYFFQIGEMSEEWKHAHFTVVPHELPHTI